MSEMTVTTVDRDPRDVRPFLFVVRDSKGATTYRSWTQVQADRKRQKVIAALVTQGHELKVL